MNVNQFFSFFFIANLLLIHLYILKAIFDAISVDQTVKKQPFV